MEEMLLALGMGIGLAAACGFRIFVPLLVLSLAARTGYAELTPTFAWLAEDLSLAALLFATLIEILAYSFPWLDNLLDSVSVPAAVVAGSLATAACVVDLHPLLRWSIAIVAGGGTAGTVSLATGLVRVGSSTTTGGTANPLLSAAEASVSVGVSLLSLLLPLLAIGLGLLLLFWAGRRVETFRRRRAENRSGDPPRAAPGLPPSSPVAAAPSVPEAPPPEIVAGALSPAPPGAPAAPAAPPGVPPGA